MSKEIAKLRRFVSMLSDYGFKITFGNETNTLFLRKSIQALIKSTVPIVSVELSRNEIEGFTEDSGGGLFDISCTDSAGHHYIIEMQLTDVKTFIKRSTFYASHRYTSIIRKGKWRFKDLKRVYMISILNGVIYPESTEYHHIGNLRNQHGELMGDEITQVVFELKKWNKDLEYIKFDIDKLIYVMKITEELKVGETFNPPKFWSEEWIENAINYLDMAKMTPDEREYVERQIVKAVAMAEERKEMMEARLEAKELKLKTNELKNETKELKLKTNELKNEAKELKNEAKRLKEQNIQSVINLLNRNTTPGDITQILGISLEEVLEIKQKLDAKS